jgi:hypothetical protein
MEVEKPKCNCCLNLILDEKDCFELEHLDIVLCEKCMDMFLNAPSEDDEMDELAEDLQNLKAK